jgi:predicted small lipoprotein YifL
MHGKKMSARICLSLIAACALLTACGQRGALYLPEESQNVTIRRPMPPEKTAELRPTPATVPAIPPAAQSVEPVDPEEVRRRNAGPPAN